MLANRVEKLKFLVDELQIAFHLATHVSDPFVARTLARHILVRAENFIAHARGLRKPLKNAGFDTRTFHTKKEEYASFFDEYFKVSRDRLGAHVQDFDFGKRLELWNDIEIVKAEFFVEGACEIFECLSALGVPISAGYVSPDEIGNLRIVQVLQMHQRQGDRGNWVEMGVDSLAMTRSNTSAILNGTPVHERAGQLALIHRWITMQRELLTSLSAYPSIVRIFKARIITDIVSFCDCLVTRQVPAGASQEMEGLDRLIIAAGQSSETINEFVKVSNFDSELQTARQVRNVIGAHLEIEEVDTATTLLGKLDAYNLDAGLGFYDRVRAAFVKTCMRILFLRLYAGDGQRMYGVVAGGGQSVPFSGEAMSINAVLEPPPINEPDAYQKHLVQWLDGDEEQKGCARNFFWVAFQGSETVETIDEIEKFENGQRRSQHEFRKAHQFLLSTLSQQVVDSDFEGVLGLIMSCRSGWPYPLAEVLVRHGRYASKQRRFMVIRALGDIGSAPHDSVAEFLKDSTR